MKKLFLILTLLAPCICYAADKYDVEYVLVKQDVEDGTYSISSMNDVAEMEYILTPTRVDEGKYTVNITRIESNVYRIDGTDLYIVTKYCYEYYYSEEVLLIIENFGGRSRGEVVFYS